MAKTPSVKTRILVMSDTHEGYQRSSLRTEPWSTSLDGTFRPPMPKADVLIHSGDLTMIGTMNEYRGALDMLASCEAELKLVIAGNHDLSLHYDYYLNHPKARQIAAQFHPDNYDPAFADRAKQLWTGEAARSAGVTYLTEGLHNFTLSNGVRFTVYASPWQPVFYDWAFNYPLTEDRWNPVHHIIQTPDLTRGAEVRPAPPESDPHPIPDGVDVDIMITHGPPYGHLDTTSSGMKAGCPHLLNALNRVRPKLHCFGHIHEAWGAEIVRWNAGTSSPTSQRGRLGERGHILGSWTPGIEGRQTPKDVDAIARRANYLDVTETLVDGDETLLINSCIMDLRYDAEGSAWLIDLDLPQAEP